MSPCPGAVGGSYDSVLLKEGDVKARLLRLGPQGTFPFSPVCPLPGSPPGALAELGGAQYILCWLSADGPQSLPHIYSTDLQPRGPWAWILAVTADHPAWGPYPPPQHEAGRAAILRGCGLASGVEPQGPARETLSFRGC